jgi:enoyl-CoA hydratase/carnithine racemase
MSLISLNRHEGVMIISLNRSEKKNAINSAMYEAMTDAIEEAVSDSLVRALMIKAEGNDFCAGNDIMDFAQGVASGQITKAPMEEVPVFRFLKAICMLDKPLVAAVRGQAVGIGTTLLFHCDGVFLGQSAKLSLPFLKLGLVPEAASSVILVQRLGYVRAFSLLTTKPHLSSDEACQLGLANEVCADGDVETKALDYALALSLLPPMALSQTKILMRDPDALWEIMVREGMLFRERLQSDEARNAFMAFMSR